MALLEARKLNKQFGAVVAAADISVSVAAGDVIGLIGTNGAGKTTFINMITGYLKPASGQIMFRDHDITALGPREITRLGIARSFQIPQLFDSLSVLENVIVGLGVAASYQKQPNERRDYHTAAHELLQRYDLQGYAERPARVLPQGVRKSVDIALAMVGQPQILLLDEPTSGVSSDEKFAIMDLIMTALRVQGVTVMFVEHDMDIVARYAQRVLAFYDGRIIADGEPRSVLNNAEVRRYVVGSQHAAN